MRIHILLYFFAACFGLGFQAKSQGFTGKIKNDSAFVELTGSLGIILVPVSGVLKNEPCDSCVSVYHFVGKSEGLYRIGKWYGNQPVAVLKKRNNLRSDVLSLGQKLLVGYIVASGKPEALPAATNQAVGTNDTAIALMEGSVAEEIKEIPKAPPPQKILSYTGEGIFASEFSTAEGTMVKKTGKASSFKSESGWSDGRFYILNSSLKAGLVVKIINPSTGVFLYAKVVGPLPDIKQNHGLSLRLNNAAASMLGLWEEEKSFELTWEY